MEDMSPFCGATDTRILDFWWHLWISKPEWAALFTLGGGVHVTHPWNSPLVWHLPTSWQPAWQPLCSLPCTCELACGSNARFIHTWDHLGSKFVACPTFRPQRDPWLWWQWNTAYRCFGLLTFFTLKWVGGGFQHFSASNNNGFWLMMPSAY